MPNLAICPKELIVTGSMDLDAMSLFEKNHIQPLIDIIEESNLHNIDLVTSPDLLQLITEQAPWDKCDDPKISSYLNSWYVAVIGILNSGRQVATAGTAAFTQCSQLDIQKNLHFKEMVNITSAAAPKTASGVKHFGVYAKQHCPCDAECSSNILIHKESDVLNIRFPWRLIYPVNLPFEGEYPFLPPKGWEQFVAPKRAQDNGYLDENGHSWGMDLLHKNHWDVQFGGGNGDYINVALDGRILPKN